MPQMLSPEATGLVEARNRAAQAMALRLAETGSGQYTAEVETFQLVWNQARSATREQLQIVGLSASQARQLTPALVVDGMFGPNTSGALYVIVGDPRPPRRASGMPAWVAANMASLTSIVAPGEPPVGEVIAPVVIDSNPQVQPSSGGQVVVDEIDGATHAGPEIPPPLLDAICDPSVSLPQGCQWTADGFSCSPGVTAQQLYDAGCLTLAQYEQRLQQPQSAGTLPVAAPPQAPLEADVAQVIDPMVGPSDVEAFEHRIPTVRTASAVPAVAVLLGVGVLGGAFWWMTRSKRRGAA